MNQAIAVEIFQSFENLFEHGGYDNLVKNSSFPFAQLYLMPNNIQHRAYIDKKERER